jgi:hypothetical protein
LARGAATAAWGRRQAGNPAAHTELACEIYCGRGAREAAASLDEAARDLPVISVEPVYEIWRRRTEEQLAV